jgi:hypothetical protein
MVLIAINDLPQPISESLTSTVGTDMVVEPRELTIGYDEMSMGSRHNSEEFYGYAYSLFC